MIISKGCNKIIIMDDRIKADCSAARLLRSNSEAPFPLSRPRLDSAIILTISLVLGQLYILAHVSRFLLSEQVS